MATLAADNI